MYPARFRVVLALFAFLALIVATGTPVGAADTFTDPQGRFSFPIPDGWQPDTAASGTGLIVQYLTADPSGAFNVTANPLPDGVSFDAVPQLVIVRLQKDLGDFQQTNLGPTSVAGEQGAELDYTATNSAGILLAVAQIMVPHNGIIYLLTLAARPEDIGAIQTAGIPILLNWQWLG